MALKLGQESLGSLAFWTLRGHPKSNEKALDAIQNAPSKLDISTVAIDNALQFNRQISASCLNRTADTT